MASIRCLLLIATVTVSVGFQQYSPEGSPHSVAGRCLADAGTDTAECPDVCQLCHVASTGPVDVYSMGDASICGVCHADIATDDRAPRGLLRTVEHGNHPSAAPYQASNIRSALAVQPSGPKLFMDSDGAQPRMYCSTCHDPHGEGYGLLRTQGEICRACHVM